MNKKSALAVEFVLLFILLPIGLAIDFWIWIKIPSVVLGFGYLLYVLKGLGALKFQIKKGLHWSLFWKRTFVTFLGISILTSLYVWFVQPEALFYVPLNNPLLFVTILFVYSVFSVWPQEVIYRTFFFERYSSLFQDKRVLVFVNAIVFSLAHLFFKNTLVLIFTFVGGLIFGMSYLKFKSTTMVTIEHAIYGNWLFTIGMGQMLAFPGMEA
ncbi:MAG: membrane protease YdiL (CAAX protease family) [Patiriisocius sp.]|jgi:membrane protease YdiL (CAAX protease family)